MNIIYVSTLVDSCVGIDVISITGFATDFLAVGTFGSYTFLIIGGVLNRFNKDKDKKVEVKEQKGFLYIAIFTIIMMTIITSFFAYSIFVPSSTGVDTLYILRLVFAFLVISIFLAIIFFNINKDKKLTKEEIANKEEIKKEYFNVKQK